MAWRNAQASMTLIAEINARWPRRDKSSDGTIGDAAHASRSSDHNPWVKKGGQGIVRARDVDKDGVDAAWLVEHLRQLGARGDPRLRPGGYIIFNRRITKPDFSGWKAYNGSNPHDKHFHVSFSTDASARGFDSTVGWGISGAPAPAPAPVATPKPVPVVPEDAMIFDKTFLGIGRNDFRLVVPVGSASQVLARAWLSVVGNGPVTGTVYVQDDKKGLVNWPIKVTNTNGICARFVKEIPSGATQLGIVLDSPHGGTILIEGKER